jgi:hypothetical protein
MGLLPLSLILTVDAATQSRLLERNTWNFHETEHKHYEDFTTSYVRRYAWLTVTRTASTSSLRSNLTFSGERPDHHIKSFSLFAFASQVRCFMMGSKRGFLVDYKDRSSLEIFFYFTLSLLYYQLHLIETAHK